MGFRLPGASIVGAIPTGWVVSGWGVFDTVDCEVVPGLWRSFAMRDFFAGVWYTGGECRGNVWRESGDTDPLSFT